jgi:hypothetical protein
MISPKTRIAAATCALVALLVAAPARAEKAGAEEPYARFWVGASAGIELAFMPTGNDLCRLNPDGTIMNSIQAFCTDPGGRDFPVRGNQAQNALLEDAGHLDGGPVLGDYRFLLSLDYALTPFLLVGARGGYVGNTYPGTAGLGGRPEFTRHLHGELRLTYLLGDAPLAHVGWAPLGFFALGAGQFDGSENSTIKYRGIAAREDVVIWVVSGPWFASLGGGARYQFSARAAFTAALRGNVSFGPLGALLTAGPEIAFQYGF